MYRPHKIKYSGRNPIPYLISLLQESLNFTMAGIGQWRRVLVYIVYKIIDATEDRTGCLFLMEGDLLSTHPCQRRWTRDKIEIPWPENVQTPQNEIFWQKPYTLFDRKLYVLSWKFTDPQN